ncbi:hypothetical protein [Amorphus orientalis]|uniref:Uncharacterized protein n=1 Tax=Amorphus orientalis TaxID=649198 RepID=A0AAE4AUF3_9HYPH|nr:hypothetical protein [Amorphus orientalis]MDQ0317368.1 hypothetical protein [Amorphus orientalis]
MPIFLVSYTSPSHPPEAVDRQVRASARDACRIDASLWLLDADTAAEDILKALKQACDPGDRMFVVRISRDYASNLPENGLRWLLAPERRWSERAGSSHAFGSG